MKIAILANRQDEARWFIESQKGIFRLNWLHYIDEYTNVYTVATVPETLRGRRFDQIIILGKNVDAGLINAAKSRLLDDYVPKKWQIVRVEL